MMYTINGLATRIENRALDKTNPNILIGWTEESLLELAKNAAAEETLPLSAKVNDTDAWSYSNRVNSNVSYNRTFLHVAEILFRDDVLNRTVELLKEKCENTN